MRAGTGTALGWVRDDLDRYLSQVRMQVENIASNPMAGAEAINGASANIDQLRLTFEALVLSGAAQVMEEMIALCERIRDQEVEDREQALNALMDAIVVLPSYLDRLQAGHHDLPVLLLPVINKLRGAYGADMLTEGTLFAPLLNVELPELEFARRPGYDEPFDYFANRMQRQYESALLNWLQEQDSVNLLSPFQGICETMRHRMKRYDLKRLWWVATEVIGGLMEGHAENDVHLRRLLARLNLLLKNLAKGGEDAIDLDTSTSVTQALLFHVAQAKPGCEGMDLVRERFELKKLLPDREALLRARGAVSGRNREMYMSLGKAVQDELAIIKDSLDIELRTGRVEKESRMQSVEALNRLHDTLKMLGLSSSAQELEGLLPDFERSEDADRESRNTSLMSLAGKLLLVESALKEQIETLGEPVDEPEQDSFIDLPPHEQRRIRSHLLDETVVSMHQVQEAVRKRFSGDSNADLGGPLVQVAGALQLVNETEISELAYELRDALLSLLDNAYAESAVPPADLEALTDAVSALELHLASCRDQQDIDDRFIKILRDRLAVLPRGAGHGPKGTVTLESARVMETVADLEAREGTGPIEIPDEPLTQPGVAGVSETPAVDSQDQLPNPIDPELGEIFLEEYETVLESLQHAIPAWMTRLDDVDALTEIRRGFHTLKGSGRMVGADELGDFSWQIEEMLNALLEGRVKEFADIAVLVRLAHASLPALRQRMLQQHAGLIRPVIAMIGQTAHGLGRGEAPDWDDLRNRLPAFLAGMLPGAFEPEFAAPQFEGEDNELLEILRKELKENLEPVQHLLESIAADRGIRTTPDQVRAVHTIAGALATEPEGREAEVAKALESLLQAQSNSGESFSNESVWALVSAVGHIQARLDRLQGLDDAAPPEDEGELISQLIDLTARFGSPARRAADDKLQAAASVSAPAASEPPELIDSIPPEDLAAEPGALDPDILAIFLEEARDVLEHSDSLLNKWRDDLLEHSLVLNLQREIHTFKGGARMAGLTALGNFSHAMESLLERIAGKLLPPSESAIQALEEGCDRLQGWIEEVARGEISDTTGALALFEQQVQTLLDVPIQPPAAPRPAKQAVKEIQEIPEEPETPAPVVEKSEEISASSHIRVAADLLDSLINSAGEVNIFRSRLEQQVNNLRFNLKEFDQTLSRLREQFRKLEIETETQIRSTYQDTSASRTGGFDPLELDEFSAMQQLSRGLSESVADLLNLQEMLDESARKSEVLLVQQSRVSTELQEGLMKTRMVHFGSIAPRLRRLVRSAAKETGKKARLQMRMVGSSDDLDRNVLERITAPLEHMLRNAIVHGIEKPRVRKKLGKKPEGEISVTVESEATEFVIRIEDDGAGINLEAIRKHALKRGLIEADAELRPQQLYEFILDSGFSTSQKVTGLAGRGVGMDVVSSEIKQIGGSLEIDSEAGERTRFTIRIPFTLAVMQAIGVMAGDQRFLLPLASVTGVARMLPADYRKLIGNESPVYEFAGQEYPVLDIEPLLGESSKPLGKDSVSLLILNAGDQRAAFRVPQLLPHREIVIKPVGPQISSVPGILGGSISADGQVLVILDPGPMIRHALIHGFRPVTAPEIPDHRPRPKLAMVVDDSITMRKVTSRVLESQGFEVITARDGIDASEQMQERVPDILLLDIEMPRMDGYGVAEYMRADTRLRKIPIIMITSRSGLKHRDRAMQAGANAYLAKPYKESELIMEVNKLLTQARK